MSGTGGAHAPIDHASILDHARTLADRGAGFVPEDHQVRELASGRRLAALLVEEICSGAPAGMLLGVISAASGGGPMVFSGLLLGVEDALRHGAEAPR